MDLVWSFDQVTAPTSSSGRAVCGSSASLAAPKPADQPYGDQRQGEARWLRGDDVARVAPAASQRVGRMPLACLQGTRSAPTGLAQKVGTDPHPVRLVIAGVAGQGRGGQAVPNWSWLRTAGAAGA